MKSIIFGTACLLSLSLQALEYEVQFENDQVHVARAKIMPGDEVGIHRDERPQIVVALKGGTITRLEVKGTTIDVEFPTGVAVFREVDPPNELYRSVNRGDEPVELIIVQLKQ